MSLRVRFVSPNFN